MAARSISEERPFEPRSPDFAQRVRASFAAQAFMGHLGVVLDAVAPGHVRLAMPFNHALVQQDGFHHAGVATTAMDSACGYAAYSLMADGFGVLTVEFKTNFLAPAAGERFIFEGRVIKPGRTLSVCQGETFAHVGDARTLIATMSATMMAVPVRGRHEPG